MSHRALLRVVVCCGLSLTTSALFGQSWRYAAPGSSPPASGAKAKASATQAAKAGAAAPGTAVGVAATSTSPTSPSAASNFPPAAYSAMVPTYGVPGGEAYAHAPTYPAPTYPVPTYLPPTNPAMNAPVGPPLAGPSGYPTTTPGLPMAAPAMSRLPTPPETQPYPGMPAAPGYRYVAGEPIPQPAPQPTPMTIDGVAPCDNGLCEDDCAPKACWVAYADLLGLTRTRASDQPIVLECANLCSAINVHEMNFGYELGLRVGAVRLPSNCGGCIWEIGYMGMPNWSTTDVAVGDLILNGPGFNVEVNPSQFVATYESSLHSIELNVRPCQAGLCGAQCSWFMGFRYIRLDESLDVTEYVVPLINALDVSTQNNLYGGQMGANILMMNRGGPFYLESTVKFGLYGNYAAQTTSSSIIGPAVSADQTNVAYVGEFLFAAGYRVGCHFDIRVGYQILGISGVALAPDQLRTSDLSTGYAAVDLGQVIAHGAFIGGSFRW